MENTNLKSPLSVDVAFRQKMLNDRGLKSVMVKTLNPSPWTTLWTSQMDYPKMNYGP